MTRKSIPILFVLLLLLVVTVLSLRTPNRFVSGGAAGDVVTKNTRVENQDPHAAETKRQRPEQISPPSWRPAEVFAKLGTPTAQDIFPRGENATRTYHEPVTREIDPELSTQKPSVLAKLPEDGRVHLNPEEIEAHTVAAGRLVFDRSALDRVVNGQLSRVLAPTLSDEVLTLEFDSIKTRSANTHTLQGHVVGEDSSIAQFVYHDGVLHGSVIRYDSLQEIEYRILADGHMMIRELDTPAMTAGCEKPPEIIVDAMEATGSEDGEEAIIPNSEEPVQRSTPGWRTVDVAVGYDQEARIADGGFAQIEARIIGSVDRMNTAFINSGIANTEMMLLGTIEDPDYRYSDTSGSGMGLEIAALRSESDGALDTVTNFSNQLGADLVSFVILQTRGGTAGVASAGKYTINARTYMTAGRMVFAHELGHNLGCTHAWGDTNTNVDNSRYGWRFKSPTSGNKYETIMAYDEGWGGATVQHYSNPNVLYDGARTGAVNGYNVLGDTTADPQFYADGGNPGFDGTNPALGANNAEVIDVGDVSIQAGATYNAARSTRSAFSVISPAAAAQWERGTTRTISFNGGDMQDLVTIKLYKGGVLHTTLATGVNPATNRNFNWTVPFGIANGTDYMIRVELTANGSTLIQDSGIFTIFSNLPNVTSGVPTQIPASIGPVSQLVMTFNVPMDPATFSTGTDIVSFTDPIGTSIAPSITGVAWSAGNTVLTIDFTPPTQPGTYRMVLGPEILDTIGNAMDQDLDGIPSESVEDRYTVNFTVTPPLIYYANMDTDPGWTFSANNPVNGWAYGQPLGLKQYAYGNPDPTSGFDGPNVIGYNLGGDYQANIAYGGERWATTPSMDCSGYSNVTLSFQRWLGCEADLWDNVYLEVSNNGTAWTRVWENSSATIKETAWQEVEYDISAVADGESNVYVRWGQGRTDSSGQYCGWNIDEVVVSGDSSGSLAVTPAGGLSSSGQVGGPFSPESIAYTLENTGTNPIQWTAGKASSWVTLSAGSGTLAGGATTTVTASINSNANALAIGNYADTVTFTNVTNNTGNTTRSVNLNVQGPGTLVVAPAGNLAFSGAYGGPFSPASQSYTLSNGGTTSINWTAAKTAGWVTLGSAGGTLAPGAETTVTVSINSAANTLNASGYSDTLTFTNTTSGLGNTTRDVALTVNKAAASITLGSLSATYNGSPKSATATTNPAGLSHTITYNGSATAPTNAATYAVLATITDTNYTGSTSGSLVIGKANQTISFAALAPVPDNASPFALGATASSGLPVSYASSDPGVASVSENMVTVVSLGSTTITASQAGDANYNPASSVQRTLDVVRPDPIAAPGDPYRVLSGQNLLLDGSGSLPSVGETVTLYQWDLNNDGTFGDVAGANPAAISFNTLLSSWSMVAGFNTIKLKVTDSAGKTSTVATTVQLVFPYFWDANGTGAGQTNGGGAWLGNNLWWNGTANTNWVSGSAAVFGGLSTNGGGVTLASPTTVDSITFNTFNGTYTLGSAGQTLTINAGIDKTASSSAVSIISPISLSAPQTWSNHSSGAFTVTGVIGGSGGITKTGTGALYLNAAQDANNYTGNTRILGGILQAGTSWSSANNIPGGMTGTSGTAQSNLELNGGTFTQFYYNRRTLGSGPGQIQITGGRSGFTNKQNDNVGSNWRIANDANIEIVWGSDHFKPTVFVMQDAAASPGSATFTLDNKIDLYGADRTVEVGASTGTLSRIIRNTTGTAGLVKTGAGTLILSANNTYNGDTTVQAGTLQINFANVNNNASKVSIAASATLNLNFSGTDTVDKLFVDGAQLAAGVYKAVGSAASGTELARLAGPGTLTVTSSPPVGPGPVDHFVLSAIASPQTVGTPITGITITAQDISNQTATSFTGTVTFGGTAGITGTSAAFVDGVLSGVSVTPVNAGNALTLTVNDGAGHTGSVSFTVRSLYDAWANGSFANPFTDIASISNPDGDSLNNLQEFAFGMDPSTPDFGNVTYVADGDVTKPGSPVIKNFAPTGQAADYRAVFARRKNHAASGLTYTAQFTADLSAWTSSATTPTRLTGVNSAGAMEAVSVPFPASVPLQAGGTAAPKFFRIGTSQN